MTDLEIFEEMIDKNFVVKMPPKRKYQISVLVRKLEKGKSLCVDSKIEKMIDEHFWELLL